MIVAIADDITGAAELAGIGLRYGLRVILTATPGREFDVDLLVVYTNTRSLQKRDAAEEMKRLTNQVKELKPQLFYKKTDSVLRGHVIAELRAQMVVMGIEKALLVPANPPMGRIIENETYYVNEHLLHETGFATDPEFPVTTSNVIQIVAGEFVPVTVVKPGEALIEGVNIGETVTIEDVNAWTSYKANDVLLAGGGCFFDALLNAAHERRKVPSSIKLEYPLLFVSGTAFHKDMNRWKSLEHLTSMMPTEIFSNPLSSRKAFDEWINEIIAILSKYNKAFITIGHRLEKGKGEQLRSRMSHVVNRVIREYGINELIIEGGSTAYDIVKGIEVDMLLPVEELSHGVVRMKVEGSNNFYLTIKPGSYPWPEKWDF